MKKLFLSLILCCLFGGIANAAAVSGTVTSAATCAVVSGQKVYLQDTFLNVIVDSAVTNTSGFYSINFPSGWTNPQPYAIIVRACGTTTSNAGTYTGASATVNAITCGAPKVFSGTVMLGSTPNTGPAKVYLIRVQRNYPTAGDTTLTAVDSATLTNSPNFSFKRACAPTDTFLLKAMLLPAHPSYATRMPSYDSSLNWSTANRFYGSSFGASPHYIYLLAGTNPGGPGFIGGSVLAGANKQAGVGDPLPARLLILTNATTNAPVAYTYSDAAGKFSFPSVAVGTYKLFGDSWGLYNVPMTVSVTTAQPTVNNIIFEEHYGENTFKGRFGTTGVGTVGTALAGVRAYPNPATNLVSLIGMEQIAGSKSIAVRNIVGAEVLTKEFSNGQTVAIAVDALPAGTYVLQLNTEVGSASFKVVK